MYQAQISSWGSNPKWIQVSDLPQPGPDELQIKVLAVGVHRVVRSRASGKHYTSGQIPHVPGVDGIGTITSTNQKCYFFSMTSAIMSEYLNLPKTSVFPLPDDTDPVHFAASINPAMSSWMAFKGRTDGLEEGFTCLILGATSASGRMAIPLARALGAKKVIGAARNQETLDGLDLDASIVIQEEVEKTDFSNLDDVDVVIDYIYGALTHHLFKSLKTPKPVQYVHIGALSGELEMGIPGEILRSKDITIRGSGPGAWNMKAFAKTLPELLEAVPKVPKQATKVAKFENIENEWDHKGSERLVFVP
ncbi:putative NADPH-dependent quinone reductase tdiC [Pseudocercospora fuligena]|uniref:Putative NADPH-dependent quinone reductase tdiC n=1 Tax=Pseudocercospora fuligena TaxID=685502 RepID=A0A8H6R8K3_9PEZI|nr:putative NADPH-dependent quinone reductase tdiC [Pseudocercospora fuligena]